MKQFKKIWIRLIILPVMLLALNYCYKYTFWKKDLARYAEFIPKAWETQDADIIYLGDCSDIRYAEEDDDTSNISELLSREYPAKKIMALSHEGYYAEVYYKLLQHIPQEAKVQTVIVTMNLRSFNAYTAFGMYQNTFNEQLALLQTDNWPFINRMLLAFHFYEVQSREEIIEATRDRWKSEVLTVPHGLPYRTFNDWYEAFLKGEFIDFQKKGWDSTQIYQAGSYLQNYGFQIETRHDPRIEYFDAIVELAKKRKWRLIFNLLPENIKESGDLIGRDLTCLMEYNRQLIIGRYHQAGVTVLDNFALLNDDEFIGDNPSSHYHYSGRKKIADRLKEELFKNHKETGAE